MPISTSHWSWPALTRASSGCGSGRLATLTVARLVDLLLGAVVDEDRLAAPEHLDHLAFGDRRQIDLDRRAGRDGGGVGIHLRDQRHKRGGGADRGDGRRSRYRENRDASARPKTSLSRSNPLPVEGTPARAGTQPSRTPIAASRRAAGGPATAGPGEGGNGTIPAGFIGTLAGGAQVRPRHNGGKSHKSPRRRRFRSLPQVSNALGSVPCGSRSTSPTSPRTPERFSGSRPASASRRISSSRPASRPPTAPSAAPAWTISTRSPSCATRAGRPSRHWRNGSGRPLVLFTTRAHTSYLDHAFRDDDVLLFGRESAGVPDEVHQAADARLAIPMRPGLRSLNVAMAAAMAVGEALRQSASSTRD